MSVRRAGLRQLVTQVRALRWWDKTVASLGWALIPKCRPTHSKLRADPRGLSEGLGLLGPKVEGTA